MAMDKVEFDSLFKSLVIDELKKVGFTTKGKSVYYDDGKFNVSLIRLGGRMSRKGAISHLLCCRHSFLPNLYAKIRADICKSCQHRSYKVLCIMVNI
jgi:hypothetical protein